MLLVTVMALAAGFGVEMSGTPIAARAEQAAPAARASKQLVVCNKDEASRRAFKRDYGKVSFVSAQEVVGSRGGDQAWSAPRCITPTEYQRLEGMVGELHWVNDTGK